MARASRPARPSPISESQARNELRARLQARRSEIEQTLLTRVYSVADPADVEDPVYLTGLRAAVGAALDYALAGMEAGEDRVGPVPTELLSQARQAARAGVTLDTVLRRYLAGHTLLGDFLIYEAEQVDFLPHEELQRLLRVQSALVDRLIESVSEEYRRESEGRPPSLERRRAECVRRLLVGELADASQLAYDLGAHHLGLVAVGPGVGEAVRELAKVLDCRLLLVRREGGAVWAWLGDRRKVDPVELEAAIDLHWTGQAMMGVGEPGEGLAGWRLTHRQAAAALPVALRGGKPLARYADVALLSVALHDEVLSASLRCLYIEPLERERDSGVTLRQTLRAYFAAERNSAATAAALGIARQTVNNRLHAAEERLGCPLRSCAVELELALALDGLERAPASSADMPALGAGSVLPPSNHHPNT